MEPGVPLMQLAVAADIRTTLFRRALLLLDEAQAGLEEFGTQQGPRGADGTPGGSTQLAVMASPGGLPLDPALAGALVPYGGSVLERALAVFVQGRSSTVGRAVDAVERVQREVEDLLTAFEQEFPPMLPGSGGDLDGRGGLAAGQPSEELLRLAAATTAAAGRCRVRAAQAAQAALHMYDASAKQAAAAAQATTRALELQASAEQHSASGNLAQALDDIRMANRLRDESSEAARSSRQMQQEYLRHRREAQEAHAQADAAMRHAYSLERDALRSSGQAAAREQAMWQGRYDGLAQQMGALQVQAASWDSQADEAVARAEEAQQQADVEMAAGNYDAGNALMEEAVRAQEQAGYLRAQAAGAREAAHRLMPEVHATGERLELAAQQLQELLQGEADELAALCDTADGATTLHEELVRVYDERLAQDRQQYDLLLSQGRTAEADALAVHIGTWGELLDVARQDRDASRAEAEALKARLQEVTRLAQDDGSEAFLEEAPRTGGAFEQLRGAADRASRVAHAAELLSRGLAATAGPDPSPEAPQRSSGGELLMQTELHRQRTERLIQQLSVERRQLEDGRGSEQPPDQAGALLDSVAISHLIGTVEAAQLLGLWKQRAEQAGSGIDELNRTWAALEEAASTHADEAVRLEEQALAEEQAGRTEEAAATMARADELHRTAEGLRLEADKARATILAREKASTEAQAQSKLLLQGLQQVEQEAKLVQQELRNRGLDMGPEASTRPGTGPAVSRLASIGRPTASGLQHEPHDELATVMMASPGMLSRASSLATLSAAHEGATAPGAATTWAGHQDDRLSPLSTRSMLGAAGGGTDPQAAAVRRELEAHASSSVPPLPSCRHVAMLQAWDGPAALAAALQPPNVDQAALPAASAHSAHVQAQALDCASLAELQQGRDAERQLRGQSLAAGLPEGSVLAEVAGRAVRGSSTVLATSDLVVDALTLHADCQGSLGSGLAALRRAMAARLSAEQEHAASQAELAALQAQARGSEELDAELRQQIRQLERQLAAFEAQGGSAQALTTRYELQRAQNKHADAAAQGGQLRASWEGARARATHAHAKTAEAGASVATFRAALLLVADAAREADEGAAHAAEGYGHAVAALAASARADLSLLGGGAEPNATHSRAAVEEHLDSHAREVARTQRNIAAARGLMEAAAAESALDASRRAAAAEQAAADAAVLYPAYTPAPRPEREDDAEIVPALPTSNPLAARQPGSLFPGPAGTPDSGKGADVAAFGSGHGSDDSWGRRPSGHDPSAAAPPAFIPLGNVPQALSVLDAELADLRSRHQRAVGQLQSAPAAHEASDAEAAGRQQALKSELASRLREAERELDSVRETQHSGIESSPGEVQASHDRLQTHEQQVAMLQRALHACDALDACRSAVQRTQASLRANELEAQHQDGVVALLATAAEQCRAAVNEAQSALVGAGPQTAGPLRQRLELLNAKAAEIGRLQDAAQAEGDAIQTRRRQLEEQLAVDESAVRLQEELLQQAQQASGSAAAVLAWERKLGAARADVQQLEAPLRATLAKAHASAGVAQTMSANAAQHRRQAADLAHQASQQREDARRLAALGQHLEADAANSLADSLQQQADGLLAQAEQMEEDAWRLQTESQAMQGDADRANAHAAASSSLVEQVSSSSWVWRSGAAGSHQYDPTVVSATALQLHRAATLKLYDASQKQAAAAEQQAALAKVEMDLADLEAQASGSGGQRPDSLATAMINLARAKQNASQLRTNLRAVQQEMEQDRSAATVSSRGAVKADENLEHMEQQVQDLQQQAAEILAGPSPSMEPHASLAQALTGASYEQPAAPSGQVLYSNITFGGALLAAPHAVDAFAASAQAGAAAASSSTTPAVSAPTLGMEGSGLPFRSSPSFTGSQDSPRANPGSPNMLAAGEGDSAHPAPDLGEGSTHGGRGYAPSLPATIGPRSNSARELQQLQRSGSISAARSGGSGRQPADSDPSRFSLGLDRRQQGQPSEPASRFLIGGGGGSEGGGGQYGDLPSARTQSHNDTVNVPLTRLRRGAANQPSLLGIPSPAVSPSGRHQAAPSSTTSRPPSRAPSRQVSRSPSRAVLTRDRFEEARSPQSASSAVFNPRALLKLPPVPPDQRGAALQLPYGAASPGTPQGYAESDAGQEAGTAAALLEKVANRSLRPLSVVKFGVQAAIASQQAAGGAGGKPGDAEAARRNTNALGDAYMALHKEDSRNGSDSSKAASSELGREDQGSDNDEDDEPDTKMYRTVKQRLGELEGRILALRRQGDTASTAVEILARKQEQVSTDLAEARELDEEQQGAVLDHGEALMALKEAEAALCHKQADRLDDEAAACQDALHYAVVDARLRRERHRVGERCDALTGKAQALAMEAQGFEADATDAAECISLAAAKGGRPSRAYDVTLAQRSLKQFVEEQEARVQSSGKRAAESRFAAARLAATARDAMAKRLLVEKHAACNKALYLSAVELADANEQVAKVAAQGQQYRLAHMKAVADSRAARVQQLNKARAAAEHGTSSPTSKPNSVTAARAQQPPPPELLEATACAAEAIQLCEEEMAGDASAALRVLRMRMDKISALAQLYQASADCGDFAADASLEPPGGNTASAVEPEEEQQQQRPKPPPSEAAKRGAQVAAAQAAIDDLDRACALAADFRAMCVEAAAAHAVLCDARVDACAPQEAGPWGRRLVVEVAADDEEVAAQERRLASLEVQLPLVQDQLGAALQAADYRVAAGQLREAQQDLARAAAAAGEAAEEIEASVAVHREALAMLRSHLDSVVEEAALFRAGGDALQAAAANEAARRLADIALADETRLVALAHEAQLKRDEQAMAQAAAAELQQVADSSDHLAELLIKILDRQQEARAASDDVDKLAAEQQRREKEERQQQELAEGASKDADLLQHRSMQCRADLRFSDADANLVEARQCRDSAQQHASLAAAARQAGAAALKQLEASVHHRDRLLSGVRMLHAGAQHLQGALSCMRNKHHLVRKLRDEEHARRLDPQRAGEQSRLKPGGRAAELEVLRTQIAASTSTIQHHLASKASYVSAADHLLLATGSLCQAAECAALADGLMQELVKCRMTAASSAGVVSHRSSSRQVDEQTHLLELRHRCLRGSIAALQAIGTAAQRASEARQDQVSLSDQAAALVSDLAAKILEAEANADEAAKLEAAMRGAAVDEDDEENFKAKLMVNALLQQAETYRGEATALQGRITELKEQEAAADAAAADLEAALGRLRLDYRQILEALDLTSRICHCQDQEAALQSQARALVAELTQLNREAVGMESKVEQLRQQLTSASHSASVEDVSNLMMVMQQMGAKASAHRAQEAQRRAELEGNEAECGRLAGDVGVMVVRCERVLQASETQEEIRQLSARIQQLRGDLAPAQASHDECERMLESLRQQGAQPSPVEDAETLAEMTSSMTSARHPQQAAAVQASVALAEQMLEVHAQRTQVLQAAVSACEAARSRCGDVLGHQEQLLQHAEWRSRLLRLQEELQAVAASHAGKAQEMRAAVGQGPEGSANGGGGEKVVGRGSSGADLCAQAAAIRSASEAAEQLQLAEAEQELAARASSLAAEVHGHVARLQALSDQTRPVGQRLGLAASTALSAVRLQLARVDIAASQGQELSAMHGAIGSIQSLAAQIQGFLEAADRHTRAGQGREGALARGQAAAAQEALQLTLAAMHGSRQRLVELGTRMGEAADQLVLAEERSAQVARPASVARSIAEYASGASELLFGCAVRRHGTMELVCSAAHAARRAAINRREHAASSNAAKQLEKGGKAEAAFVVALAAAALERSLTRAEADRRFFEAQSVHETDAGASGDLVAEMHGDLAALSVRRLRHVDELEACEVEHQQLGGHLEAVQRSLQAARVVLQQRRGELQSLGGHIEAHRADALVLVKRGKDAQATVRRDAVDSFTHQLADMAEEVLSLERLCRTIAEHHLTLIGLHAKSEARVGLLSQLHRLYSAAIGHTLDARDAYNGHTSCLREAAVLGVKRCQQEAVVAELERKVREAEESASQLQAASTARVGGAPGAEDMGELDPEKALRAVTLANARLQLARQQRVRAEQLALSLRGESAQAELAAEASQLCIIKARQRAEDAQGLVATILTMLGASNALGSDPDVLRAALASTALLEGAADDGRQPAPGTDSQHGLLAAAQLHSVTLQALTEASAKVVEALEVAAAADESRSRAHASGRAAQAARDAAELQRTAARELSLAAQDAGLAQQVHRLKHGWRLGGAGAASHGGGRVLGLHDASGLGAPASSPPGNGLKGAAGAERLSGAAAAAEAEAERNQHEAAYLEAATAQELKLVSKLLARRPGAGVVGDAGDDKAAAAAHHRPAPARVPPPFPCVQVSCLEQQHALLRRAADCLLEMARHGIRAEANASAGMTAPEAASLMATCKQLSLQHAAALTLGAPLDACKRAEACLRASLGAVQQARQLRQQALSPHLQVAGPSTASGDGSSHRIDADGERVAGDGRRAAASDSQRLAGGGPAAQGGSGSSLNYSRSDAASGIRAGAPMGHFAYETAAEKSTAARAALGRRQDELLVEEEWVLQRVQEVDAEATQLLLEGSAAAQAFDERWAAASSSAPAAVEWLERAAAGQGENALAVVSVARSSRAVDAAYGAVGGTPPRKGAVLLTGGEEHDPYDSGRSSDAPAPSSWPSFVQHQISSAADPEAAGARAAPVLDEQPSSDATYGEQLDPASSDDARGIDSDLIALAAAAVSRAKAAAALLSAREHTTRPAAGQHPLSHHERPAGSPPPLRSREPVFAHSSLGPPEPAMAAAARARGGSTAVDALAGIRASRTFRAPDGAGHGSAAVSAASALRADARTLAGVPRGSAHREAPGHAAPPGTHMYGSRTDPLHSSYTATQGTATTAAPTAPSKATPTAAADAPPPAVTQRPSLVAARPQTPVLSRLSLPDGLDPGTAAQLLMLWSAAALHYQRAQHMQDGCVVQLERQWEAVQARLQGLQAEQAQARGAGRAVDAAAAADAAARWQQRAGHLHSACQRKSDEAARFRVLARRATAMGERLQLLSATAIAPADRRHGHAPPLQHAGPGDLGGLLQPNLVPRLPGSVLAGSGVQPALERLHGGLEQQVAALRGMADELQQHGQRLFAKASERSDKLKRARAESARSTAPRATAALSKSHAYAEQAAVLAERAAEQSARAGLLQDHAEALAEAGEFDALVAAGQPRGACWAAAQAQLRGGEDLAREAAQALQRAKEELEGRGAAFARALEAAAAALSVLSAQRSRDRESLLAQGDAARLCVVRAQLKCKAQQAAGDTAAADKYRRAAEGWARQADKLRRDAMAAAAAAEELSGRARSLGGLGSGLRPCIAALEGYLDEQMEAWAAAALSRVQPQAAPWR
ncbi:hypothetical protein TSOC_005507 [Tetrabaena socialis]|uniref:Uncharacterized protein n=1 Tax=Tetrabaena socialis TaxID=47790 RepID=A0A2J8A623_9CHLO|nr:hypothetical protein TSOC_005507 [Tetrabaena socialis]|eukprot:PNH07976.1 hypothetical protein TSOC_005507 [Tetrabaena socialis]